MSITFKPAVKIYETYYPGYGSAPCWKLRAVHKNRLLEEVLCYSERDAGMQTILLKSKWAAEWNRAKFKVVLAEKPLASPVCDICGNPTIGGTATSCCNKLFCSRPECQAQIEVEKAVYTEQLKQFQTDSIRRDEVAKQARLAAVEESITGAFHWRDGWYFSRSSGGCARIMHRDKSGEYLVHALTIPPNEWASIVCSVSALGETAERWNEAQDFHGRPA